MIMIFTNHQQCNHYIQHFLPDRQIRCDPLPGKLEESEAGGEVHDQAGRLWRVGDQIGYQAFR